MNKEQVGLFLNLFYDIQTISNDLRGDRDDERRNCGFDGDWVNGEDKYYVNGTREGLGEIKCPRNSEYLKNRRPNNVLDRPESVSKAVNDCSNSKNGENDFIDDTHFNDIKPSSTDDANAFFRYKTSNPCFFHPHFLISDYLSLISYLKDKILNTKQTIRTDQTLETYLKILSILNIINDKLELISCQEIMVDIPVNVKEEYRLSKYNRKNIFQFINILPIGVKSQFLKQRHTEMMKFKLQESFFRSLFEDDLSPFLTVVVRRSHFYRDCIREFGGTFDDDEMKNDMMVEGGRVRASKEELKKQIRVVFSGEDGVDSGGMTKEFFQLLSENIIKDRRSFVIKNNVLWINTCLCMCNYKDYSNSDIPNSDISNKDHSNKPLYNEYNNKTNGIKKQTNHVNCLSGKGEQQNPTIFQKENSPTPHKPTVKSFTCRANYFGAIGRLLGISLYNDMVLNIPFPTFLFKIILNKKVDIYDLAEIEPEICNSLQKLKNMDDESLEMMDLRFSIDFAVNVCGISKKRCMGWFGSDDMCLNSDVGDMKMNNDISKISNEVSLAADINVSNGLKNDSNIINGTTKSLKNDIKLFNNVNSDFDETLNKDLNKNLNKNIQSFANIEIHKQTVMCNLVPNGDNIKVTSKNISTFIDKYVEFLTYTSIKQHIESLKTGFYDVINDISFIQPVELEKLIVGTNFCDVDFVKSHTVYDKYTLDSPIIKYFWELFESDIYFQRRVLQFITGSDRLPVSGLKSWKLVIMRNGCDSDRLPSSQTCYNTLLLPEYKDKEKFIKKIRIAVYLTKGFYLS
ncbi:Ubiquitin-protein ligase E3A [Dictyocoela roeselum]|nr:Ubiquitin-protein ligase E3A [Dictyocoela roeselum]